MNPAPKTIQIFLPEGDPRGIRIAEITTRIVQVIEVPRSLLQSFFKMPKSDQVAVYFLFGASEDNAESQVYIGESSDLRNRLATHNKDKDFWQRALVLVSLTNSLTLTHARFLEWHCLQESRKAGRYRDLNGNCGIKPHTPEPLEADCIEIFETGQTLLATLGYPIFDPVATQNTAADIPQTMFALLSKGVSAKGVYTTEGFVVLKGSRGLSRVTPGAGETVNRVRESLLESGVIHVESDFVVFDRDHLFRTPSAAAMQLLGRSSNGWMEWKTQDGRSLDHVVRTLPNESE